MQHKISARRVRLCLLAALAVWLLGGCSLTSTPIQYASAVPPEQTCTLKIIKTLVVLDFDGENVRWQADGFDAWAAVQIPAGSHVLVLNYRRDTNDADLGYHYRNSIKIRYDKFQAGHVYELVAAEGAEAGGFTGLFTNPFQAMHDTVVKALRLGIRDATADPDGDFEWLTPISYAQ